MSSLDIGLSILLAAQLGVFATLVWVRLSLRRDRDAD